MIVGDLAQIFPDRFGGAPDSAKNNEEGATVSFGMSITAVDGPAAHQSRPEGQGPG